LRGLEFDWTIQCLRCSVLASGKPCSWRGWSSSRPLSRSPSLIRCRPGTTARSKGPLPISSRASRRKAAATYPVEQRIATFDNDGTLWTARRSDCAALPAGSTGDAAIYTEHVKLAHIIRKVLLRQIAITNYVNPF
jgi:hypothetical protein